MLNLIHLPRIGSDHNPLSLIDLKNYKTPKPVRYEAMRHDDPNFKPWVESEWGSMEAQLNPVLISKKQQLVPLIKIWNQNNFCNIIHDTNKLKK